MILGLFLYYNNVLFYDKLKIKYLKILTINGGLTDPYSSSLAMWAGLHSTQNVIAIPTVCISWGKTACVRPKICFMCV